MYLLFDVLKVTSHVKSTQKGILAL